MKQVKSILLLIVCTLVVHQAKTQFFLNKGDIRISINGGYADVNSLNLYRIQYIENTNNDWQPQMSGPIGFEVSWSDHKRFISGINYSYVKAQTGIQYDANFDALYKTEYTAHQILWDSYINFINYPNFIVYTGISVGSRFIDYNNNYVNLVLFVDGADLPFEISQFASHVTILGTQGYIIPGLSYTLELGYGAKGVARYGLGYTF